MNKRARLQLGNGFYRFLSAVVLLGILLTGCRPAGTATPFLPTDTPFPTPTMPPYTPPPPGTVPAKVIQRSPDRGEELPPDGVVELVFDRPMDRASVEAALSITPEVDGDVTWVDDRTVRFKPARDLKRDTEYYVTVAADARTGDGDTLDGAYRFRFRTVGYLEVAQVVPAPDTTDVEALSTITVIFNRPVVPLAAVSDPMYADLPQPLTIEPAVTGRGEWLNTSIYVFTPDTPLAGGTTYTVRIAAGLTDTTGGLLEQDYVWSFSTQPPKVVDVYPADEDTLVPVDTAVRVRFNMPIDCSSAGQAFQMRTGLLGSVQGKWACQDETFVFTPTKQLDFDKTYRLEVAEGVRSAGGGVGMADSFEWSFTTVPLPRIVGTRPADGEREAWPYTDFEIIFNAPIDPATVLPNLEMTPPLSPTQVYTYFRHWDNTYVLAFGAQPSTDYEVRIGPDIADPYGNTTDQAMTVRFRTAPLDPALWLPLPNQVGVLDAHQPAQIVIGHVNVEQVNLELYALGVDDFFSAQRNWWDYRPSVAPLRQWSLETSAPLNEAAYTPVALAEGDGLLPPGLYLLSVQAPEVQAERWSHSRLLVVSDYNLTVKSTLIGSDAEGRVWAWLTDLATGRPVEGATLTIQTMDGDVSAQVTTDEDGLAHTALGGYLSSEVYVWSEEPFVLAGAGWGWSTGIGPDDFGLETGYSEGKYRAYIYTDRPLYRAGQTVYFRGVVRAENDVQYSLPDGKSLEVTIYDPMGETVFQETLPLNAFGAFHGELTLSEEAPLGQYSIQVNFHQQGFYADFQVAAYRPPEFEVTVTPDRTELAAGQATQALVEVSYFFGGPVADVDVEWSVLAASYRFEPAQFGRYDFTDDDDPWVCRWCWWWEPPEPQVVLSGSGRTDAQGQLTVILPTEVMTGGQRLTIEATASGRDGQVISGRSDIVVHRGDFYVGLAPQQYVGQAGRPVSVDVVTVDWAGERRPGQSLTVEVYRREWINTFVKAEAGGGQWEWTTQDTRVYTATLTTNGKAEGVVSFTPEEGGSYRVVVGGLDAHERPVRTSTWLWVSGREYVSWRRENNDRLTLVSDKSTYVPGETAEILIPSPFAGEQWAWVTVERAGVRQQEVLRLENNSTVYRLPITTEHVPNIYVSAVIVKGPDATEPVATHKVGYVMLTVEPVVQELHIELTPSVPRAEPGETVSFEVRATDVTGEPVEAALSLDLVDKAVLTLRPRTPDAILQAFYGRRGIGIVTASGLTNSVNRLLWEKLQELADQAREQARGVGGGGVAEAPATVSAEMEEATFAFQMAVGEEDVYEMDKSIAVLPPGIDLREEFADTAFWDATVVTDRTGRATVDVTLPDNLTTWVLRAVAVTAQTEVGETTTELLVTKPLLLRPVTPRFFVVGDHAQLAALVSNYTGQPQEVAVTLHAEGLSLEDSATQTVSIPDGGEQKVTWWVTVEDVPTADVAFSAVAGEYADAARPRLTTGSEGTLLVHRYTAPEIVGTGGQLVGEDVRVEVVALPPKYDDRRGELSIRLDPSLAAGMMDGLDYLEHFPYECTEQTVSRFLPNVLTYRAMRDLGFSNPQLEAKLPGLVAEGLSRLYGQQHGDGGWGWWYESESNPYLSAYVVFGLVKAQEAGFEVRDDVLARGLDYLADQLVAGRELHTYREANRQAFILYVMSEAGQTGRASEYSDDLFSHREKLSHYGRAFLALTLNAIEPTDGRVATLLSDIQNAAILSATGAHWEEAHYDWWAMNTDTRSTAVILDALARLDADNALIPQVVRWLMIARRDGIWETTQETAWALIALTDWMVVTGELEGAYDYGVWLNDAQLSSGSVTPQTVDQPIQLRVDVAEMLAEVGNRLTIGRGPGEGRLYYTAHLKVYLPVEEIEPLNRGIIVSRRYSDPACTEGLKCPEVERVSVGDIVQVHLTIVAPHDLYYVAVEDPLPAGAEPIDPSLATTSLTVAEPGLYRDEDHPVLYRFYHWWWQWYSRSEMRDDKVVLFADYLPAGTYEYTYTFRATQPGEYQVIPTTANEFYFPEVFGRGAGRSLVIE